jgi:hypothetical protein
VNAGSLEGALRLQKLLVFSIIMLLVSVLGYMLADDAFFAAFAFAGMTWLVLMPYHATLSVTFAVATFSTALILPFFPGRPFIWEAAALLGWTGCVLVFSFRQYRDEMWNSILEHKWMLVGVAGYCAVLVFTMMERGVGFRTMGGSQMGGRYYFQQLTCAIFPLLFIMVRLKEEQVRKLFIIQCALSATWVISDVIYTNARGLFNILFFLEIPGDAMNFERERMKMGINRYQSLAFVSVGFLWLLLIKNKLNDFLTVRGVWLVPAGLIIVGAGLLSGHRYTVAILVLVMGFMVFTQKLITMRNAMGGTLVLALGLTISYGFAERMPLAAQRALSALPGITVHRDARLDGMSTMETRRVLREEGLKMMSQYLWVGRGFGQSGFGDHSLIWDPTAITYHINQGRFYNGFIGLMVNTGLFGTCFMFLFLIAGSVVAMKVIFHLREHGVDDEFSRVSCLVACLWMANVVAFIALHGDSEYAMKTFSLQAGLLIVCQYMLRPPLRAQHPGPSGLE